MQNQSHLETSRLCTACGTEQPLTCFYRDHRTKGGVAYRTKCKACSGGSVKARRALQPGRRARSRGGETETPITPERETKAQLREKRIDLGIAIAHATCLPGARRRQRDLAAYAGISRQALALIELEAIARVRSQVQEILDGSGVDLRALMEAFA